MQNLANHLDPLEDIQSHKVQNQNTEHSYGRQYVDKSDGSKSYTKQKFLRQSNYDASPKDGSWARTWPRNTMLYIHMCFEDS